MFRIAFIVVIAVSIVSAAPAPVEVHWLDTSPPAVAQGVSFGVPWPRGAVAKDAKFHLLDGSGKDVPLQIWPLAYWPDGSLKWTGNAISGDGALAGPLKIDVGDSAAPASPLKVTDSADAVEIENGATNWRLAKHGSNLVEAVKIGDTTVAKDGKLVCILEDRSDVSNHHATREQSFASQIDSVSVEQSGPVRAVVKIQGKHKADEVDRAFLPFTIRLYFFAGVDSVRMVHSFAFDGDQEKDFIRGLGVRFAVPMREQAHNRHVRIAGSTGMFAEPLRLLVGRRLPSIDLYRKQVAGQRVPSLDQLPGRELVEDMAVWDGFKITQLSPDSFAIQKRTNDKSAWIDAAADNRALGTAFIGDVSGGFSIGLKDFWQLAPTEIEIEHASTDAAELTLWLWSPDVPAMDLRHYDIKAHGLEASYEDIEAGFSTATGVARTHEITLCPFKEVPSNDELLKLSKATAQPPRLVCSPEYYHSIPVFGVWSLPDRSTPAKKFLEDRLAAAITFYQGQIDQRRWYGFWNFGDVMHSYDPTRHEWRYDVGGFAWANTELEPDLWLWYSFLRTGRGDVFRMAEAMTRHTQEVDVYHLGRFAGLGSRHNVRHWGDGAKELRVSQALLKRPYYYLTTDERVGDLMNEVIDADKKLVDVDPLRKIEPKTQYPTHARIGPDWFAACSNWLAAWERTGDTKYRDKIVTGMKCIAAMPHKLFSGDSCGYDPAMGKLYQIHDEVAIPHLAALMGGPELMMELSPLIDLPEWNEAWLNYCRYLQAPADEQKAAIGGTVTNGRGPHFSRMTAYAAHVLKDAKLAARAWQEFFRAVPGNSRQGFVSRRLDGADVPNPVDEVPDVSTNDTAQWCLNAIELLQLIGDQLPEQVPTTQPR